MGNLNFEALNTKLAKFGYEVVPTGERIAGDSVGKKLFDAGSIALLLFIVYYFASELNLLPSVASSTEMSLTGAFVLGLVASTSTCMATSGALFMATIGKLRDERETKVSPLRNFLPAVSFNVGRVGAYAFFGFLAGFLGKTVSADFQMGQILNIVVAALMFIVGLDMLKLFSLSSVVAPKFTKGLFEKLEHRFIANPKKTALLLGAITYLLPCGFTQTVQLYALGLADPVKSAMTMAVFALGTVPALLAVGFATSFTKTRYYAYFTKVMGVLIIVIGLSYVLNSLRLYGVSVPVFTAKTVQNQVDKNVVVQNGYQVATMNANASGYYPSSFTVKKDVPVRWVVKGENVFGCQGLLVAPKIGVSKTLTTGENIIEFTPTEKGPIRFSCAMGMFQGQFNVI